MTLTGTCLLAGCFVNAGGGLTTAGRQGGPLHAEGSVAAGLTAEVPYEDGERGVRGAVGVGASFGGWRGSGAESSYRYWTGPLMLEVDASLFSFRAWRADVALRATVLGEVGADVTQDRDGEDVDLETVGFGLLIGPTLTVGEPFGIFPPGLHLTVGYRYAYLDVEEHFTEHIHGMQLRVAVDFAALLGLVSFPKIGG